MMEMVSNLSIKVDNMKNEYSNFAWKVSRLETVLASSRNSIDYWNDRMENAIENESLFKDVFTAIDLSAIRQQWNDLRDHLPKIKNNVVKKALTFLNNLTGAKWTKKEEKIQRIMKEVHTFIKNSPLAAIDTSTGSMAPLHNLYTNLIMPSFQQHPRSQRVEVHVWNGLKLLQLNS